LFKFVLYEKIIGKTKEKKSVTLYLLLNNFDHFLQNMLLSNFKPDIFTTVLHHCLQKLHQFVTDMNKTKENKAWTLIVQ
jgi:hypothetical protein